MMNELKCTASSNAPKAWLWTLPTKSITPGEEGKEREEQVRQLMGVQKRLKTEKIKSHT